ncbi:MAG: protoporphyrinogen IX oxidase [Bacteroidetes bacterium]|nr:MAG: protoporphyrinogen IX oxidase [Bacteroidota bacterium]
MYNYIKALHIIFIVTWFAGLFYMVRLFIYNREAQDKSEPGKSILSDQFRIMIRRLWFGITWPSAILALFFGGWLVSELPNIPTWLKVKLGFVIGLILYHLSLQYIFSAQMKGNFKFSSQQLRLWNEVATIFLVAIVMLVVVKESMSWAWGLGGLFAFVIVLMVAIRIYKSIRTSRKDSK